MKTLEAQLDLCALDLNTHAKYSSREGAAVKNGIHNSYNGTVPVVQRPLGINSVALRRPVLLSTSSRGSLFRQASGDSSARDPISSVVEG
ncbi:hypothetical protein E2C01_044708 [Portunus trituberculatus]|uniref:Uncharacterized protein n=1 Tax=Portunus trituberculatus TaxID=210409 RepID=A0A5B7G315_PORTR|nr:hypothetical protein [Portunus trituberculatus]